MKNKHLIPVVWASLVVASCGSPSQELGTPEKAELTTEEQHMQLTEADLFAGDKIRIYLRKDTLQGSESNKLFLQALDKFKNKKDLVGAELGFKASLLKYPTAKAYYELGNVCLEKKDYKQALDSYRMAENLNYEPFSKLMYNIACVYSGMKDGPQAANYLEYAIESGYLNVDNLSKDPDLKYVREEYSWLYQKQVKRALNGVSDMDKIYYIQFKKRFPQMKLPVAIKETVSKTYFEMENAITYDFEKYIPEMRDGKFSREVSKGFYYYAKVQETAKYTALIYVVREEFMGEEAPLTYKLVTFDNTGTIIDELVIAGREEFNEELRQCSINAKMEITIDLYETKFEKDPETEGYYENPIVSKSKVGTEKFKINAEGKIIETSKVV